MNPPSPKPADDASLIKPMALWLVIQLLALAIGSGGVRFSAKLVNPPELLSIQVMATIQAASAALLWPILMRSWRVSLAVVLTAIPFFQAVGFLSATPFRELATGGGILFVWLVTLAVLPRAANASTCTMILRAVIIAWCVGGAIVSYLAAEFSNALSPSVGGPIVQILSALQGENALRSFFIDGFILIGVVAARMIMHRVRATRVRAI